MIFPFNFYLTFPFAHACCKNYIFFSKKSEIIFTNQYLKPCADDLMNTGEFGDLSVIILEHAIFYIFLLFPKRTIPFEAVARRYSSACPIHGTSGARLRVQFPPPSLTTEFFRHAYIRKKNRTIFFRISRSVFIISRRIKFEIPRSRFEYE